MYKLTIYFRDGTDPMERVIVNTPEIVDGEDVFGPKYLTYQVMGSTGKTFVATKHIMTYMVEEVIE